MRMTILLEMNKPSPVPSNDLDTNLVNNLGKISGSIPWPESVILTTTYSISFALSFSTYDSIVIVPFSVNLSELLNRLNIT